MRRYIKQVIQVIQMSNIYDASAIQVIQVRDSAKNTSEPSCNICSSMQASVHMCHAQLYHAQMFHICRTEICVNLEITLVGAAWSGLDSCSQVAVRGRAGNPQENNAYSQFSCSI